MSKIEWVTFTRRTDDPKLAFIEQCLSEAGIHHKRMGESFHAPILTVPADRLEDAEKILKTPARKGFLLPVRFGVTLDDVPDGHPFFEKHTPFDFIPVCEGPEMCGECAECLSFPNQSENNRGL